MVEGPGDALRSFGGKLGETLARAAPSGAILFGLRIPKAVDRNLYFTLAEVYEVIEGKPFDWVVPLVVENGEELGRSEKGHPEGFAGQLARFCMRNLSILSPTIGLIQIGVDSPPPKYPESTGLSIPYSGLVGAVKAQGIDNEDNLVDLAPLVAAYMAAAPRDRGLAGTPIHGIRDITPIYNSDSEMRKDAERGIIAVDYSVRKGFAIQKPVTQNPKGASLSGLRALFECLWKIKYGLRPFLGEPQSLASLRTKDEILDDILGNHPWIQSYEFDIQREGFHSQLVRISAVPQNEVTSVDVFGRILPAAV